MLFFNMNFNSPASKGEKKTSNDYRKWIFSFLYENVTSLYLNNNTWTLSYLTRSELISLSQRGWLIFIYVDEFCSGQVSSFLHSSVDEWKPKGRGWNDLVGNRPSVTRAHLSFQRACEWPFHRVLVAFRTRVITFLKWELH